MIQNSQQKTKKRISVRSVTVVGMLSAIGAILMMLEFPLAFIIPSFVKFDFSDLPALIGAFTFGPVEGILICLVKNLIHLTVGESGGVGELSNFILGASFVGTAGLIYKIKRSKMGALFASLIGAFIMALISIASNYFIVYPFYSNLMPIENIILAYQEILPNVGKFTWNGQTMQMDPLLQCLVVFNAPFTFLKAIASVIITFISYKRLSPILRGDGK